MNGQEQSASEARKDDYTRGAMFVVDAAIKRYDLNRLEEKKLREEIAYRECVR